MKNKVNVTAAVYFLKRFSTSNKYTYTITCVVFYFHRSFLTGSEISTAFDCKSQFYPSRCLSTRPVIWTKRQRKV